LQQLLLNRIGPTVGVGKIMSRKHHKEEKEDAEAEAKAKAAAAAKVGSRLLGFFGRVALQVAN